MEQITHVNATVANLFTNFTPINTTVPVRRKIKEEKRRKEERMFLLEKKIFCTPCQITPREQMQRQEKNNSKIDQIIYHVHLYIQNSKFIYVMTNSK